jgi:hypothetical protein
MTTPFRIIARMVTAVVFYAAATAVTATAADYYITWKNQFASTAACTLNASVVGLAATIPNNIQHKFTRLSETVQVRISSPNCSRITLSAVCKYTDAQGKIQTNGFSPVNEACGNYLVTLNPTIPGSFSITPGGGKTPLGM